MSDPQSVKSDPRPSMLAVPIPKPRLPKHLENEPTVTMVIPHAISFHCDEYMGIVHLQAGIQEIPMSLSNHWYVVQQGGQIYEKPKPVEVSAEDLASQLRAKGYAVEEPLAEVADETPRRKKRG